MKQIIELQEEFEKYNNIRQVNNSGQIEVKINKLYKNNQYYWNIMINDFVKDISFRWHVKENEFSFEEVIKTYFYPLTKYFKERTDIRNLISNTEDLQVDLISAYENSIK